MGCLLAAALLLCLQLANVQSYWKQQRTEPTSIDQVLMEQNTPTSFGRGRSAGGQKEYTDGMDMILSEEQYNALFGQRTGRSYNDYNSIFNPWKSKIIPYEIVLYLFNEEQVSKIKEGMRVWEGLTCVRFRPKVKGDRNWIRIFSGEGCYSQLSMVKNPGPQWLSLAPGCYWRGTVEHEFGHAIGLVHEHQRPNRDEYLGINIYNVQPFAIPQLTLYNTSAVNKMGLPYDYMSLMHYGQHAFAYTPSAQTLFAIDHYRNRRPDITEKLGRVMGPSFLDVKLVNMMYKCDEHCSNAPKCDADCIVDQNCKCFCEKDMNPVPCTDHRRDCTARARAGHCNSRDPSLKMDMGNFCRKTCGVCAVGDTRLPPNKGKPLVKEICKDTERRCSEWERIGDCQRNPGYMLEFCRKSCKVCEDDTEPQVTTPVAATTTAAATTTEELPCKDDDELCPAWARNRQCSVNPSYMLKHCRKSCKKCNVSTSETCEDEHDSCPYWARNRECEKNQGYMLKHCRKSCKECTDSTEPECTNLHSEEECEMWASYGACYNNPSFMSHSCPQTCGFC